MDSGLIDTTISFISCGHRSKYGAGEDLHLIKDVQEQSQETFVCAFWAEKTPRKCLSTYIQQNSDVATKGVKCLNWYPCKQRKKEQAFLNMQISIFAYIQFIFICIWDIRKE